MQPHVQTVRDIAATLDSTQGPAADRRGRFQRLQQALADGADPIARQMALTTTSFGPGLFVGPDDPDLPRDNLDLERWFRQPKGHERRIHGRCHAGVRIVLEGPTLVPALDAHLRHPAPFETDDLLAYASATLPETQRDAIRRRRLMRQARSTKARPLLLISLEQRYHDSS